MTVALGQAETSPRLCRWCETGSVTLLDDDLLARIHSRAPGYDRENSFLAEDLAELKAAGYLRALVPIELGGLGLTLQQLTREQSRLAAAAPATALAVNMHLVWTGVAKTLRDRGDDSLEFVLMEAAAGEVYAFAISEAGNDLVLFGSTTEAHPLPGGAYSFSGTKIFTSLSPAWTRLGMFGLDTESVDAPKLVHGFVSRDVTSGVTTGITTLRDWDTIGMRASQSNTTVLDNVVVPAQRIVRRLKPGPSGDSLIFGIFANFEILIAAVYTGIGQRALELAVEAVKGKTSARTGLTRDKAPGVRWRIAEAAIAQDALQPQVDALANDVDALVDHGDQWFRALVGIKARATRNAKEAVDAAMGIVGGSSFSTASELARLYRDVAAGAFHPSNDESVHATVATALLGPE